MKYFAILLTSSILAISAKAGSFGGPAPFSDGSPLESGIDGAYQAIAQGVNLTGVIRFSYFENQQTAFPTQNNYVMFVDGEVLRGSTTVAINETTVAGVLEGSGINSFPTNDDGTVSLPVVFVIPGNAAAGQFKGSIDLKHPQAKFSGKGLLTGTAARVDQIIAISEADTGSTFAGTIFVTNIFITNTGSSFPDTQFNFRGVRLNTSGLPTVAGSTNQSGN